jgi:hypothetical protein
MIEAILLAVLPLVRRIYDDAHAANPFDPKMTDEELKAKAIAILMADADKLIGTANAWLAAHPGV